jgi:hypothetical protein
LRDASHRSALWQPTPARFTGEEEAEDEGDFRFEISDLKEADSGTEAGSQ